FDHAVLGRALQHLRDLGDHRAEGRVLDAGTAGLDVRSAGDLAGGGVDDHEDGDDALVAEDLAVLQGGLTDVADGEAVDVDVAGLHLAGDLRLALDEVDDHAVLGDDDPVVRDAGEGAQLGVGPQVAPLAVHRHPVPRPADVVEVQQLAGGGVTRDVHLGVALVDDVGAPAGQAVDHAVDRVLV